MNESLIDGTSIAAIYVWYDRRSCVQCARNIRIVWYYCYSVKYFIAHAPQSPLCHEHVFVYPFRSQIVTNLQRFCMDRISAK